MKIFKKILLVSSVILISACSTPAQFENMAYTQEVKKPFPSQLNNQVDVTSVTGGSSTNPMWTSQISNEDFQKALELSLSRNGLLANDGRYDLKVTLLEVKQPMFGLDFEVVTKVSYILVDTETSEVILDEVVQEAFTATFSDAAIAVTRLRMANEGSGKANIQKLLELLTDLKIESNQLKLSH